MAREMYHPSIEAPTADSSYDEAEKWRNDQAKLRESGARNLAKALGRMTEDERSEIAGLLSQEITLSPNESRAKDFDGEYSREINNKKIETRNLNWERRSVLSAIEGLNSADDTKKLVEELRAGDETAIKRCEDIIYEKEVELTAKDVVVKDLSEAFGIPSEQVKAFIDLSFVERLEGVLRDNGWNNTNESVKNRAIEIVAGDLLRMAGETRLEAQDELVYQPTESW